MHSCLFFIIFFSKFLSVLFFFCIYGNHDMISIRILLELYFFEERKKRFTSVLG